MKKRFLSAALALCMVFGSAAALPDGLFDTSTSITASADATSGNYTYEIKDGKAIITKYNGKEKKVTIPSKLGGKPVTVIDDDAFSGNKYIQNVFFPSTLERIESCAFQYCTKLAEIKIPAKTMTIKQQAFEGCTLLRKVTFETGVDNAIGWRAFKDCTALTELDLGGSVTYIGEGAFMGCNHLKGKKVGNTYKLVIPDSVAETGGHGNACDGAFQGCTALTEVSIGIGLVNLGANTFHDCTNLTKVTLGRNVKLVGQRSFIGTKITSVTIPASVTAIEDNAFEGVTTLKTVKIESGKNKTVDDYAFKGCTGLTSIDLGKSVTAIGTTAFENCTALTSITIPDSVTGIYSSAFLGCKKLAKVTIGNGVTSVGYNAFGECSALKTVSFGNNIETIEDYAFENCSSLEKVVLKPNTNEIGTAAFGGCTSLKSVIMPGVQKISEKAFQYDIKLSEVVMGEGSIGTIAYHAFLKNENLTKVVIPESAVEIGTQAFGYNTDGKKRVGFTIYGVKGSDAEKYAKDNGFKFVAIAKHTCNYEKIVVPKTCTENGCTVNVCKICGKVKETNTVKKTGHKWSDWKIVKAATCAATGTKTHYCTVCGKFETATIAKNNNHKWSDWKTTGFNFKNNTCSQTRSCSVCKKTATRTNQSAIHRFAGSDRAQTAVFVSNANKGGSYKTADTVVIATGFDFHDALAAVPLASAYKAPLLLADRDNLSATTLAEIKRLKPKQIIVVATTTAKAEDGSKAAIGSKVYSQLKGYKVTKLTGSTYFETAKKVAQNLQTYKKKAPTSVFITTNKFYADALTSSPVAAILGAPILYVDPTGNINANTKTYLNSVKSSVTNVYIVGGTVAVSANVEKQIKSILSKAKSTRFAGADRYETGTKINNYFKNLLSSDSICITKGQGFPDALAGGVFAAKNKSALVLTDYRVFDTQKTYLKNKKVSKIYIFGGEKAVPTKLAQQLAACSAK